MIGTLPAPATPLDAEGIDRAQVRGLYTLIYATVGNREAAEDLTGEIVLTALSQLNATPEHDITAWLDRAARNAATDYWRPHSGRRQGPPEHECVTHTQAQTVNASRHDHAAERARALLDRLPEDYRAVLSHRVVDGASVAETARRLGISEAQVKVLQHQALKHAAHLRANDVRAIQSIAEEQTEEQQEGDDDASIQSRPSLCRVTPE